MTNKKTFGTCIKTGIKLEFNSALEAAKTFGAKSGSAISKCCRENKGSVYGYKWNYQDPKDVERLNTVIRLDPVSKEYETYDSPTIAARENNINLNTFYTVIAGVSVYPDQKFRDYYYVYEKKLEKFIEKVCVNDEE